MNDIELQKLRDDAEGLMRRIAVCTKEGTAPIVVASEKLKELLLTQYDTVFAPKGSPKNGTCWALNLMVDIYVPHDDFEMLTDEQIYQKYRSIADSCATKYFEHLEHLHIHDRKMK